MLLLRRRGFTLIELMVALVLLGIVAGGIYKVLVTNQRPTWRKPSASTCSRTCGRG